MLRRSAERLPTPANGAAPFERHLLRLSVEDLSEDRARCRDCGRTPLIGEDVHVYEHGRIVCELCRQLRPEAPVSIERCSRVARTTSTI